MEIRVANENDIDLMVKIDRECFGKRGLKKGYFIKKLNSSSESIIVAYDDSGEMVGFVVFEILKKNDIPRDFCDLKIVNQIKGRWVHMVAFTPRDKYVDKELDSKILLSVEKMAKNKGCVESYVPLPKDHPFKENGVFEFWEKNEYENIGKVKWRASSNEFIDCFFYRKSL